jgi:hypothetical protein
MAFRLAAGKKNNKAMRSFLSADEVNTLRDIFWSDTCGRSIVRVCEEDKEQAEVQHIEKLY